MKISVIIPTYKPKEYLWECLDSLVKQTFPKKDFEVVLVLNGCTEPYKTMIEKYIAEKMQGMNVNFIHTDVGGVSNARNLALDVAIGEYITFLDDDDYLSRDCLREMLSFQNGDVIVECYPYAFEDGDKQVRQKKYGLSNVYEYCVRHNCNKLNSTARKFFSGPCMKLIPSYYIGDRRFDTRFKNGEDSLFMFSISDKIKKVVYTTKNAVYYRRFRKNSAVSKKRSIWERIVNNWKSIKEYTKIYRKEYSLYFYLTRIAAEIRGIIMAPINSRK